MLSFDPQGANLLQRTLAASPPALAHALAYAAGLGLYACDHDGVRRACPPLIREAIGCSRGAAHGIAWRATAETMVAYADVAYLLSRPEHEIRARAESQCTLEGTQHLVRALEQGGGAVLFSAHFACMYLGALRQPNHPTLEGVELAFLMRQARGLTSLVDKLAAVCDRRISIIDIDDPMAPRSLITHLRGNQIVACMYDFFYEGTALVITPFLGGPCATPGGMARIAAHTGCTLLPQFTFRDGSRYHTVIRDAVALPAQGSLDERTVHITALMNECIEREVLARPSQWSFWRGLDRRRKWATVAEERPA
jgi:lauroyl/myristoyl acyltransferase